MIMWYDDLVFEGIEGANCVLEEGCTIDLVNKYAGPSRVCVDIGAHVGVFTVFAARKFERVFSFEPQQDNYSNLVRNIAKYANNATAFQHAVDRTTGQRVLHSTPNLATQNSGMYSLQYRHEWPGQPVDAVSLGFVCDLAEHIDYMKIDTEGGEYSILYPCDETKQALTKVSNIEIEYHNPANTYFYGDLSDLADVEAYESPETIPQTLKMFLLVDCGFWITARSPSSVLYSR